MADESFWIERAQSAEARLATLKESQGAAIERVKQFKTAFGVRERSDGTLSIDFAKFANAIGIEGALELRKVIDETYSISGEPGAKPKIRMTAAA